MPYLFVFLVAINAVYLGFAVAKQADHSSFETYHAGQTQQQSNDNN